MRTDCSVLTIGTRYSRDDLVRLWGLMGRQAISRGVVTPAAASQIILFVTQHKTADMTDYHDQLVGEALTWEGDGVESHTDASRSGQEPLDEIHLFFRDTRPEDFIYCGELTVVSADLTHPNGRFELRLGSGQRRGGRQDPHAHRRVSAGLDSAGRDVPPTHLPLRTGNSRAAAPDRRTPAPAADAPRWGWAGSATRFLVSEPARSSTRCAITTAA